MSATGFSYAQAARGQPTTSGAAAAAASPPNSALHAAPQEKDSESSAIVPNLSVSAAPVPVDIAKPSGSPSSPRKVISELPPSPPASSTVVGTTAESSSNYSFDEGASHPATADKPTSASTPGTRPPPSDEVPKKGGRKSKSASKSTEKDAATTTNGDADKHAEVDLPKAELAPAPVPAVNIWSQRMMQHAAKAKLPQAAASSKSSPATPPRSSAPAPTSNGTKGKDAKKAALSGADVNDSNGTTSSNGKPTNRRPIDSTRSGAEQSRRIGPRGTRGAEKDDKSATSHRDSPPPVHDPTSWPTPESSVVVDDARAKVVTDKPDSADKEASDESSSLKSRKKGWVHMPFVPTVNFQTPIPAARSSKPKPSARVTRDPSSRNSHSNGSLNNTVAVEKVALAASSPADSKQSSDAPDATKDNSSTALPTRPSTQTSAAPHKRFPTDASNGHSRDSRKPLPPSLPDKPKESTASQSSAVGSHGPKTTYTANTNTNGDFSGPSHQISHHSHAERRAPFVPKNGSTPQEYRDNHVHSQRGDRAGRGGFRGGRGGGSSHNQHLGHSYQPNGRVVGSGAAHNPSSALPPTAAPFTPPSHQLPQSQQFYGNASNSTRSGGRASNRPQATSQPPVSYGGRSQHGSHRMYIHPSHGSNVAPAEYQTQPYSFPSFNPYMDNELLHGLILQVDYYFSLDNLCKDFFLRKQMNDQGFVPLSTIAKFKRMSELAPSLDFIRAACEQSENLDYVVDQEQNEWIRSRQLRSGFVLPPDERNEDARKPGPDLRTAYFRSAHSRPHQPYSHFMMPGGYPSMQQPLYAHHAYPINGPETMYNVGHGSHMDYVAQASGSNGELNGRSHKAVDSQLSASVPDFSPGGNVRGGGAPMTLEDYQTYPDEQVEKLVVLVKSDTEPAMENGSSSADCALNVLKPSNGTAHVNAVSLTLAAGREVGEEPYPELRAKALEQRTLATSGETPEAMMQLYRFWSHCLSDKFNVRMYEDFRSLALEDARRGAPADFGLKCLVQYYNRVLFSSNNARPYPAVFGPHHAEAKKLLDLSKPKASANGDSRT